MGSDAPREALTLTAAPLTVAEVDQVACGRREVRLDPKVREQLLQSRAALNRRLGAGEALYGINTGFGSLSRVRIEANQLADVQRNLIRSHASGVGEPLPVEVVRAMMLILAASLARGCSGVRPECVEKLLELLNRGITPVVPSRGSVGASGDLAPLAHVALVMLGEGRATYVGAGEPGGRALLAARIEPLTLEAKEGLALINGTHLMTAMGALALRDLDRLVAAATVSTAMAIDACRATDAFLDARLYSARCQPGPARIAERLRTLLAGSTILTAHKVNDPRVQDPYCLRAAPTVLGAACDALDYVRGAIERELGAVTDNPLVFVGGASGAAATCEVISGANFHGMPIAIALDVAKIAIVHIAGIAERRVNWLLTASDSENPVHAYLSPQPGLHSGLMIAQYAAAACCNEMQTLAHPASVHNITTSAGIEDYNSFGPTAGHHLRQSVELCRQVVAIELLTMTEAMEYQRPFRSGSGVEGAVAKVREHVARLIADRPPAPDIAAIAKLVREGAFTAFTA